MKNYFHNSIYYDIDGPNSIKLNKKLLHDIITFLLHFWIDLVTKNVNIIFIYF